jgi:very-short-patch-repair endonuclease
MICGKQSSRLYGKHLKSHNITSKEYLEKYPNSLLSSKEDRINTSKNSGKHMKQEKYKKIFSEKIKGENNPNSRAKTTEEQRKKRSPFSKYFLKYENENEVKDFSKKVNNNIGSEKRPNKIEYWLNKGYNEIESMKKVSERQSTFSLEKCKIKYGEENGKTRWMERQEKWIKNYKKSNFSMVSQKLFWSLYENIESKDNVYFATLKNGILDDSGNNNEYVLKLENSYISPDFFILNTKKVIEFDGTYYHRENPENKKREENRNNQLKLSGFEVLHVKENDYRKSPEDTLSKCLEFLNKL